jgi:hypothetical protein
MSPASPTHARSAQIHVGSMQAGLSVCLSVWPVGWLTSWLAWVRMRGYSAMGAGWACDETHRFLNTYI